MTATSQMKAKADAFYALHHGPKAFIIPNPWDAGSARLLAHLGFKALATTSMGYAFSIGQRDGTLTRDQTFANAADLASATDLPVSADLENGFGDSPEIVAETIRFTAATGIVGGSIEDSSGNQDAPIYDIGLAVARIEAGQVGVAARAVQHGIVENGHDDVKAGERRRIDPLRRELLCGRLRETEERRLER